MSHDPATNPRFHSLRSKRLVRVPGGIPLLLSMVALLAVGALLIPVGGSAEPGVPLHLELRATEPVADTTLAESPDEIRLYFSEAPQMEGTSVRLADANEELVPTTAAEADEEDPRQLFIMPGEEGLQPGSYTVHWRVIAQDGHAQNGTFGFSIQP